MVVASLVKLLRYSPALPMALLIKFPMADASLVVSMFPTAPVSVPRPFSMVSLTPEKSISPIFSSAPLINPLILSAKGWTSASVMVRKPSMFLNAAMIRSASVRPMAAVSTPVSAPCTVVVTVLGLPRSVSPCSPINEYTLPALGLSPPVRV